MLYFRFSPCLCPVAVSNAAQPCLWKGSTIFMVPATWPLPAPRTNSPKCSTSPCLACLAGVLRAPTLSRPVSSAADTGRDQTQSLFLTCLVGNTDVHTAMAWWREGLDKTARAAKREHRGEMGFH